MKTASYLDAAKKAIGVTSDYALAKQLGVAPSRIGNYRSGRSSPDVLMCVRLAQILGLDELKVIADIEAERAATPDQREVWKRIAAKAAAIAGAALGLVLLYQVAGGGFDITEVAQAFAALAFPAGVANPLYALHTIFAALTIAALFMAAAWCAAGARRRARALA